jgi:hypothetical protein
MKQFNMVVSKKEGGEYKEVGKVVVPMFDLIEFGLEVTESGVAEDGLSTYSDERVQFVYDAVCAATKADARNKLVSGSATLKAGNKIADSVAELIAKAERSGAALAINREFITSFTAYLAQKSAKSAAVQALYAGMVKNRQSIALSTEARRNGLLAQVESYTEQATAEEAEKFANILTAIAEACSGATEVDDSDL